MLIVTSRSQFARFEFPVEAAAVVAVVVTTLIAHKTFPPPLLNRSKLIGPRPPFACHAYLIKNKKKNNNHHKNSSSKLTYTVTTNDTQ